MMRWWIVSCLLGLTAVLAVATFVFVGVDTTNDELRITPTQEISIDNTRVRVSIADTPEKREQGLSGISSLAADEGMLFVFEKDGRYSFWMKDMLLSIDMLWIGADGSVVSIEHSATPESYPSVFTPATSARYVLELPSGFVAQHGIGVGSKVTF